MALSVSAKMRADLTKPFRYRSPTQLENSAWKAPNRMRSIAAGAGSQRCRTICRISAGRAFATRRSASTRIVAGNRYESSPRKAMRAAPRCVWHGTRDHLLSVRVRFSHLHAAEDAVSALPGQAQKYGPHEPGGHAGLQSSLRKSSRQSRDNTMNAIENVVFSACYKH